MMRPTASCLFLYSTWASLVQPHKMCCTVSYLLPHIQNKDDTFCFLTSALTLFLLPVSSRVANVIPFFSCFSFSQFLFNTTIHLKALSLSLNLALQLLCNLIFYSLLLLLVSIFLWHVNLIITIFLSPCSLQVLQSKFASLVLVHFTAVPTIL